MFGNHYTLGLKKKKKTETNFQKLYFQIKVKSFENKYESLFSSKAILILRRYSYFPFGKTFKNYISKQR